MLCAAIAPCSAPGSPCNNMAKSVSAIQKGLNYQARFWWTHALQMAHGQHIASVVIECDDVAFVDDVVVRYHNPVRDPVSGTDVLVHHYQCKFHATLNGSFSIDSICDPDFIHTKESMLVRLYRAYKALRDRTNPFLLTVVSNWGWSDRDTLSSFIADGMIRTNFFDPSATGKLKSDRQKLQDNLAVDLSELQRFLEHVRFELGVSLDRLTKEMAPWLHLTGFKPLHVAQSHVPYDTVIWTWFGQGQNSFDRESLLSKAASEDLLDTTTATVSELTVRSFVPKADRTLGAQHVRLDMSDLFQGRNPKTAETWNFHVPARLESGLLGIDVRSLPRPVHAFFQCHLSIAFLLGRLADVKSGIHVIPTQLSRKSGNHEPWPDVGSPTTGVWEESLTGAVGHELALAISVSQDVRPHVTPCLEELGLAHIPFLHVQPNGGPGQSAVAHTRLAWSLGHDLRRLLLARFGSSLVKIHVFFSCPAAFAFILGDCLRLVAPETQLYEHDFEGTTHPSHRYSSSLLLR